MGRNDYNRINESLATGYEIYVTVYKDTGLIRSIESSVDFSPQEKYEHIYELTQDEDGVIRYSGPYGSMKVKNLGWCMLEHDKKCEVDNELCDINAENKKEFDCWLEDGQVCLFGLIDGKYRRVSNIIINDNNKE